MQESMSNKANINHAHSDYASTNHNHNSVYALINHGHNGYATSNHNHDNVYSKLNHTHLEYTDINQDYIYSTFKNGYNVTVGYTSSNLISENLIKKSDLENIKGLLFIFKNKDNAVMDFRIIPKIFIKYSYENSSKCNFNGFLLQTYISHAIVIKFSAIIGNYITITVGKTGEVATTNKLYVYNII